MEKHFTMNYWAFHSGRVSRHGRFGRLLIRARDDGTLLRNDIFQQVIFFLRLFKIDIKKKEDMGFILFSLLLWYLNPEKKSRQLYLICLLTSTANHVQFSRIGCATKGQIISKSNFLVLIWTKNRTKLFFDFFPEDWKWVK